VPATVVDAVETPFPCPCRCHELLSLDERAAGIAALYRFDDAMRGFGQTVIWDLAAPTLWRVQQQLGAVKWVAVRDGACIHSRLLGFCVHELIHAMCGDPEQPNWGTPVGLPYGVPESVPASQEAAYLHTFNQHEARAWVGLGAVAYRLFAIEWPLLPARDVGTYGFPGGAALVDVPPGYRRVAHYDHVQQPRVPARPRDGAAAAEEAGPQRSVRVRLDAKMEAVLWRVDRRVAVAGVAAQRHTRSHVLRSSPARFGRRMRGICSAGSSVLSCSLVVDRRNRRSPFLRRSSRPSPLPRRARPCRSASRRPSPR